MADLAVQTKNLNFQLEQVQDFTPTPMTVSTEAWYTGYDPYTLEPVYCAKTPKQKLAQRQFFFWYKPEERPAIEQELKRIGHPELIKKLYDGVPYRGRVKYDPKAVGSSPELGGRRQKAYPVQPTDRTKDQRRKSFNPNFHPAAKRGKKR